MDPIVAKYAGRAVPRYTSYPTAPHFGHPFPASTYRGWLERLDPDAPVSLYLHVPFCREMCWYCGCNMKLAARYQPVAAYVETLLAEIELVIAALPGRMRISHLHWGGGTPTALEPGDLARVMARLRTSFGFTPDAEIAIESDPRTLTDAMIAAIGELGFTRASFGVQEFDPAVQEAINRRQPPAMVAHAVAALREAGVPRINFDLIYGLPHQTTGKLTETIALCRAMRPDRVALFGYAHVPWVAKNQRLIATAALPDAAERADQAACAAQALRAAGYQAVGLDHYALADDPLAVAARTGTLRRNFQGYTTDTADTLIGLGATAIGHTPLGFVQNIAETGAWARAIGAGTLPVARGLALDREDRLRGFVIERIMCDGAVDTEAVGRRFGVEPDWCAPELASLAELERDGLLELAGGRITLSEVGRPFARVVAHAFDAYHARAAVRHSVAV